MKKTLSIAAIAALILISGIGIAMAQRGGPGAYGPQAGWHCPWISGGSTGGQGSWYCPWNGRAGYHGGRGAWGCRGWQGRPARWNAGPGRWQGNSGGYQAGNGNNLSRP